MAARWRRHLNFLSSLLHFTLFHFSVADERGEGGCINHCRYIAEAYGEDDVGCMIGVMELSGRGGKDRVDGWEGLLLLPSEESSMPRLAGSSSFTIIIIACCYR